ncbi:MAG: AAA family ATPase [Pseudomonadota bacterium]
MDLRKSIEKAKKMREGEAQPNGDPPIAPVKPLNGDQWSPPVYTQSGVVRLNTVTLAQNRIVTDTADLAQIEAYKVLRARILQQTRENGLRTIMVTSASPGEGKTITAINLAFTFAKEHNQTVLLVDADLRRQQIHKYLGIDSKFGLADHIVDDRPIADLIMWPGIDKLTVISGGRTVHDSAELIGSPKMKTLVTEMKDRYADRYIFFDCPPVLSSADTLSFIPCVDAVLMVSAADHSSARSIKKALELIPKEKLLGFAMNRSKGAGKAYYY